jgi:formylglycine-generating enzyme required for sulfatase activity
MTPTLGIGSTKISAKDGMTLLYVPAGEFTMGLNEDEEDNFAHKVTLDPFWIDQTEVTTVMYARCDEEGACDPPWSAAAGIIATYYGNPAYNDFPVIYVSWNDARDYCAWAERRLPTEAEWEKAARGTDERIYPWGDNVPTVDLANHGGLVGNTTSVFEYLDGASPYGVLNMAGNVWEWVADYYDPSYYQKSRSTNPTGPSAGDNRVMRGGSWRDIKDTIRVVHRLGNYPLDTSSSIGLRCAMSVPR